MKTQAKRLVSDSLLNRVYNEVITVCTGSRSRKWSYYYPVRYKAVQAKAGHMHWIKQQSYADSSTLAKATREAEEIARKNGMKFQPGIRQYRRI